MKRLEENNRKKEREKEKEFYSMLDQSGIGIKWLILQSHLNIVCQSIYQIDLYIDQIIIIKEIDVLNKRNCNEVANKAKLYLINHVNSLYINIYIYNLEKFGIRAKDFNNSIRTKKFLNAKYLIK